MQFTPQEMKLIERWRKQERRWPRTRWILIGVGAVLFACYGYLAYLLFSTLDSETFSPADSALMFAVFWPKVILLKLLDAHQKETDRDENIR